jgi:hypothetical protein
MHPAAHASATCTLARAALLKSTMRAGLAIQSAARAFGPHTDDSVKRQSPRTASHILTVPSLLADAKRLQSGFLHGRRNGRSRQKKGLCASH